MVAVDEELRRRFESDWDATNPIDLREYVPPADSDSYLPTLEEIVCIDLEFSWIRAEDPSDQAAAQRKVEWYLEQFPLLREREILTRLVEQEILVRCGVGDSPNVTEYQRRFPDVEVEQSTIRKILSGQGTIATPNNSDQAIESAGIDESATQIPTRIGEYVIQRQLGRGGMGSVYCGLDPQTGRQVAIKVSNVAELPPELRIEALRRVEQEIRLAAGLRHDNIVPVYEVGVFNDQPYYTMPVLDSDLANETRNGPLDGNVAAKYIAQAARGVEAAHELGLLHRDIKPSNLMLDRSRDRVLIADFGLAQCKADEQLLTRTGQILGTPPYMAPEQIRDAHQVDRRADVYSLGATLYQLLAGRPPFAASEPAETLRQVLDDDPLEPQSLNRAVDLDLNTICIRCLHKEPALRYPTASELAEDLERYLNAEPIKARPLSSLGKFVRWQRRNPTLARVSAALAGALVLLAVVASIGWLSTRHQLSRVVATSRQGQAAIDDLFTFLRTEPLLRQPGDESVRRQLLHRGIKHYHAIAELAEENEGLATEVLAARVNIGLLTLELDGPDPAIPMFESVISDFERLPDSEQRAQASLVALGDAWNGLAQSQRQDQQLTDALKSFDTAVDVRRKVSEAFPEAESVRKLANATMNRGTVLAAMGRMDEAVKEQASAQSAREKLLAQTRSRPESRDQVTSTSQLVERDYAQGLFMLARLDLMSNDFDAANEKLLDATNRFEALIAKNETDLLLRKRAVECMLTQAMLAPQSGHLEVAAGEHLRLLAMMSPENRSHRITLIKLYHEAIDQAIQCNAVDSAKDWLHIVEKQLLRKFDQDDRSARP